MSVPKWRFFSGSRRDRRSRGAIYGGGARGKKRDFERAKFVFCPGVLGFATPIGSTSAHLPRVPLPGVSLSVAAHTK